MIQQRAQLHVGSPASREIGSIGLTQSPNLSIAVLPADLAVHVPVTLVEARLRMLSAHRRLHKTFLERHSAHVRWSQVKDNRTAEEKVDANVRLTYVTAPGWGGVPLRP